MARHKVEVKGPIFGGETEWLYNMLGVKCTSARSFKRQLESAKSGDTVIVEINSPGGSVTEGAEIYEAIRTFDGEIECHVVGMAGSAASFIACAAKSTISPMGSFFIHNCSTQCSGNQHDMRKTMENLKSTDENMVTAYKAKTGMSDDELYKLMENETLLSAQRAVELGFIDEVAGEGNMTAFAGGASTFGIAAAVPGFADFGSIDLDKVRALHDAYTKAHEENAEGGIEMANNANAEDSKVIDDVREVDEPVEDSVEEPVEEPAGEAQADEGDKAEEPETADDAAEGTEAAAVSASIEVCGYEQGVTAERERIRGILTIANSIPSEMLASALFDEPLDAQELAFKALSAKQDGVSGYMARAREDAKASKTEKVAAIVNDAPAASKAEAAIDAMAAMMAKKLK